MTISSSLPSAIDCLADRSSFGISSIRQQRAYNTPRVGRSLASQGFFDLLRQPKEGPAAATAARPPRTHSPEGVVPAAGPLFVSTASQQLQGSCQEVAASLAQPLHWACTTQLPVQLGHAMASVRRHAGTVLVLGCDGPLTQQVEAACPGMTCCALATKPGAELASLDAALASLQE